MIIYVIYTDRQVYGIYFMNTKFLLYTYKLDYFSTNTVLFTCALPKIIGLQLSLGQNLHGHRAMQTDTSSQLFKSRVDSHATHDIDIIYRRWFQVYFHP